MEEKLEKVTKKLERTLEAHTYYKLNEKSIECATGGRNYILKVLYKALNKISIGQAKSETISQCDEIEVACDCITDAICSLIKEKEEESLASSYANWDGGGGF